MATLRNLTSRMRLLERDVKLRANEIAKDVGRAVLRSVAINTPVDTSKAVSNWQIGYDEPNFTNLPPHFPGQQGSTRAQSTAETIAVGNLFIRSKRPGVELHISNGLDYIEKIDLKSSSPGFKDKAIAAGKNELAKAKLGL
ncbi:MAG: hypothetical protein IT190_07585 [Microbacteriaceae bacterium]|nr:hypothetical protein [Microbacteriaceae bacterium]